MEIDIKNMPIIEKRKLVKSGASFVVSLPRKWLEEHNLIEGGDIIIRANGELKIVAANEKNIEDMKKADLVIWENYPLSAFAKTLTTLVDGRIVFDIERDGERQELIAAEKAALKAQLDGSQGTREGATGASGQ